jgi:hypothetical protein
MYTKIILLLVVMLSVGIALGETPDEKRRAVLRAKVERLMRIEDRIRETRPRRRESPVREDNIRDVEVKEIQSEASQVWPGAIINISTVVVGCPCEEGPSCSDQVWIVAHRPRTSMGLLLSKIGGHWTIGAVQRWWLEYEELQARTAEFPSRSAFMEAEEALTERFPACAAPPKVAGGEAPRVRPAVIANAVLLN